MHTVVRSHMAFSTTHPHFHLCRVAFVLKELKKLNLTQRLVFRSSAIGMGFDSPCVVRIIHAKPPRRIVDFQQQIGRAGREGQKALSIVYYDARDLSQDMEASMKEYCLATTCSRISSLKKEINFLFIVNLIVTCTYTCCAPYTTSTLARDATH